MDVCFIIGNNIDLTQYDFNDKIVVGIDKGAYLAYQANIKLDYAIGDFDSISAEELNELESYTNVIKLNPIKEAIKGKKIILIDDSIVRGTTSKKLLDLVKEAEPAEIHFLVGCPPVIAPCFYGVAMATKKELIAANFSVEEIKKQLDIDTLGYITLDSLIDAIGMPAEDLCLGCLNEEYPTELPDDIEAETYYKP